MRVRLTLGDRINIDRDLTLVIVGVVVLVG